MGQVNLSRIKREILVFPLIGFVQGFILYLSYKYGETWLPTKALDYSIYIFFFAAPLGLYLSVKKDNPFPGLIFSVLMAFGISLLAFTTFSYLEFNDKIPFLARSSFGVSKGIIFYIALSFFQTWQETGTYKFPYPQLFRFSWNNILTLGIASIFSWLTWSVFWLWGMLFKLIEINIFHDLFNKNWFIWTVYFGFWALGIAFLRDQEKLLLTFRKIIVVFSKFLGLFLGAVAILFLAFLPFTGIEILWKMENTSVILLSIVMVAVFLINAVIQDGDHLAQVKKWQNFLFMGVCLTLPVYAGLAFYGLEVRVEQYGLTPARVFGWAVILGAILVVFGYAFSVFRDRLKWADRVIKLNPLLAVGVVIIAIVVHIPPLNPYGLSASNQYNRLKSGKVDAKEFDYGLLQYEMGAPGRKAIARMLTDSQLPEWETVKEEIETLEAFKNYYSWRSANRRLRDAKFEAEKEALVREIDSFTVTLPEGGFLPDAFKEFIVSPEKGILQRCRDKDSQKCGFFLMDFDGTPGEEIIFFSTESPQHLSVYYQENDKWNLLIGLSSEKPLTWEQFISMTPELVFPVLKDLEVDGIRFEKQTTPIFRYNK
ncbi:MAG: DUF4153 domain-containing protein [Alphaproteobacteria bacterium]